MRVPSAGAWRPVRQLAVNQLIYGLVVSRAYWQQVRAATGRNHGQDLDRGRAADLRRPEETHQGEAPHVAAQGLGRVPGRPGEVDERAERNELALDRVENRLLALRP